MTTTATRKGMTIAKWLAVGALGASLQLRRHMRSPPRP
jgi:hypothetical protein